MQQTLVLVKPDGVRKILSVKLSPVLNAAAESFRTETC